jgi:sarcosine oxidase gamma subunit
MPDLNAVPAFAGMKGTGSGGGVHAALCRYPIVSVLARKGQAQALMDVAGVLNAPRRSGASGVTALGIGPGRWLFLNQSMDQLAPLSGMASLSDHYDSAKGVPVDLHPSVFTDDVAVTIIAHIGAIVWQSAPDHFSIAIFRSYAGSFWHWLSASAAEFGLVVEAA